MAIQILDADVLPLSVGLGEIFHRHYPDCRVIVVQDIPGEDHIFAWDEQSKPMFNMLVSTARRFAFTWYYIHPRKGLDLVEDLRQTTLMARRDFVIKYPNLPFRNAGWPSILRYGRYEAGQMLHNFIVKGGNPQLELERFSDEALATYRMYNWYAVPGALDKILAKAKTMAVERLKSNPDKLGNIRGYCLYAGCAYSLTYPQLGFGMRDIDVQVFFSPEWYTNTRAAFTRHCNIPEFGEPAYFDRKTRWLDLMWNSFHVENGTFADNVCRYVDEMRRKSDRWATISQRPMWDLTTKELIYTPQWLQKVSKLL